MRIYPVQNNENTSFTSIKGRYYRGLFDPKNEQNAKIVDALENSKTFKKLFKKFDAYLTYDQNISSYENEKYANVEIFFTKAKKIPFIGKIGNFFFGDNRRWFTQILIGRDSSSLEKANEKLLKNIENAKFEDLTKRYQLAQKK